MVVLLTSAMSLIRDDSELSVGGPAAAWVHRGVQRPGQRPVQRDAATAHDTGDVRTGIRIRLGRRLYRQHGVAPCGLRGIHRGRRTNGRAAGHPDRRRPERSRGHAGHRRLDGRVRAAGAPRTAAARGYRAAGADVDRCARRLPQAVVGSGRRVEAGPKCRLLPARQRGVPGRIGRRVHVRRGAWRQRLRRLRGRCAAVRRQPPTWWPRPGRCSAGCSTTASARRPSSWARWPR